MALNSYKNLKEGFGNPKSSFLVYAGQRIRH
jgi:hypothetical protein